MTRAGDGEDQGEDRAEQQADGRGGQGDRLHGDLARYAPSAELIVLPAANPGHIAPTDFGHAGQLITQALTATRTALATGTPNPPAAAVTHAGLRPAGPDVETGPQD